ncbi:F-box/kelch-repeat protein At2g44130-like [Humulus lupulus]|uniref:F-box/kelch-repeat protein At2g44130-like n=1 Tax=Humulus lupulus TaxID=3486 RepID=UPI002B408753|nr:F-box/kelch-repeat protein At2g44130-like [Humulus lupulus]
MTDFTQLISELPDDLALECLTRFHYSTHRVSARVCRSWRLLFQSPQFYYHRKLAGHTRKVACLVQVLPGRPESRPESDGLKQAPPPAYGVSIFDPVSGEWDWVDPVPKYPRGLPLFCQVSSSEGKLVVMGGWDPASYEPVKDVFVYDFTSREWRQGKDMPEARSFFAAGEMDGRIFVSGGHDESKNAMCTACVYDVGKDEWTELNHMSQERDECEGLVIGSKFWVVSGYRTESQGNFEASAEWYDPESGEWRRVENVWKTTRCPRSNIGVGKDGKLICWADSVSEVRVGACGIELGGQTYVSGSGCQGGPQEFFLVERQNGKMNRIEVPQEFLGFVQSGCCVEV